jgi:GDP-L-fucose synthase
MKRRTKHFFSKNLRMALNVMDCIANSNRIKNATFILSTCIFPEHVNYPVDIGDMSKGEPHPTNYGYAYAKRMLEVGARALRDQHGKNIKCLIPCNLYGPNDNFNIKDGHVIPSLIHKCYLAKKYNKDFIIWGSGAAEREFLYAPDLEQIMKAIHIDNYKIDDMMIISSKEQYTIKHIVDIIVDEFKFKGKVIFDKSKPEGILRKPTINDKFLSFIDANNIKLTSIENGLKHTIEYFNENYANIRK